MDAERFDALVRALPGGPRRSVVTGLVSAGLLTLATRLAPEVAGKKNKRKGKNKKKRSKKKRNTPCPQACPAGQQTCGGECVDLRFDPNNCGFCGNSCPAGACLNGACICHSNNECKGDGCVCVLRKGEGFACMAGIVEDSSCNSDADCPQLGSFCVNAGLCTISCKE